MPEEVITEDQASAALHQLSGIEPEESAVPQEAEAVVEEPPVEEAEPEIAVAEGEEEFHEDDLASLQSRNSELESSAAETKTVYEERLLALQKRNEESQQILRDKYLRKSNTTASALNVLKMAQSENGASEEDVRRIIGEIEGTMNPASASYVAPAPQITDATEDQKLEVNRFLNEMGMSSDEENAFGGWVRNEAESVMPQAEQDVANRSLDGFLRLAHNRWQGGMQEKSNQEKRTDAVKAVKSVQRTQRQAAKAASASGGSIITQPAGTVDETDVSKLTPDDISNLVRQSVEQYK